MADEPRILFKHIRRSLAEGSSTLDPILHFLGGSPFKVVGSKAFPRFCATREVPPSF